MAGRLTIQKYPAGLLDFLSMRGSGDAPHELAEQLTGMVDLTPFYLSDKLEALTSSTSAIANDNYQTAGANVHLVPAGEIWIPVSYRVSCTTGAGTSFDVNMAYLRAKGASVLALPAFRNFAASRTTHLGYQWPLNSFLLPSDQVGFFTSGGAYAIQPTAAVVLDFYRIKQ